MTDENKPKGKQISSRLPEHLRRSKARLTKNELPADPTPAKQPVPPKRLAKKEAKPTLEDGIRDLITNHYEQAYDTQRRLSVLINREGNPVAEIMSSRATVERFCFELDRMEFDVSEDAVKAVLRKYEYKAKYRGEKVKLWVRVAGEPNQWRRVIDLKDAANTFVVLENGQVKLTQQGCQEVMLRSESMEALPMPASEPDPELDGLNPLLEILNLPETEQYLLLAWMAYVLTHPLDPSVSQVFLVLLGQQGSGKSAFCKWVLRRFLDPNHLGIQAMPTQPGDMAIAARQAYMLIFDNLRSITPRLSDWLCKVSTGGTFTTRKLFTNDDAYTFSIQALVIFNAIVNPVTEPDLVSRCVFLNLKPLNPASRMTEQALKAHLQAHEGRIFRALLELAAQALSRCPDAVPQKPQRMMDFSCWLVACEQVMGLDPGYLEDAYALNQAQSYESSLAEQPLANALFNMALMCGVDGWTGTASELLPELEALVSDRDIRAHFHQWPHNPTSLGKKVKQHMELLDSLGVVIDRPARGRERLIYIACKPDCPWLDMHREAEDDASED